MNLANNGWDVYQYPRVLARYAAAASPRQIVVGLTMINKLSNRYYEYEAYRRATASCLPIAQTVSSVSEYVPGSRCTVERRTKAAYASTDPPTNALSG